MKGVPPPLLGPLSKSLAELKPSYDVVVVGSGYGGAVTALRMAEKGKSVCVLERGREFRPGDYPDTLLRGLNDIQVQYHGRHHRSRTALFDFRVDPQMTVLVGCGLGGTSLINANVALTPDAAVFRDDKAWPKEFLSDAENGTLSRCFADAAAVLRVAPEDPAYASLKKVKSFQRFAEAIKGRLVPAPVTVNFKEVSPFDATEELVMRGTCVRCGDCVAGCNYAAKNTLIMTYLPLARKAEPAAQIFTEAKVVKVEKNPNEDECRKGRRWTVRFEYVGSGRDWFTERLLSVSAGTVVLAAGVLGSTEILLRSETPRPKFSRKLGEKFSGNGDILAFAYNSREPVNAIGLGYRSGHGVDPPGTSISSCVHVDVGGTRVLLQDGVIPGALSPILTMGFLLAGETGRLEGASSGRRNRGFSPWRLAEDYLRGGKRATQTVLGMVDDATEGSLRLGPDGVRVDWPNVPENRIVTELLQRGVAGVDGTYVASPFGRITVHPLGGCAMGKDADAGVVDHTGLVFDHDGGHHDGLYVCDASIIPRRLGVNPFLTITALAERAAPHILRAHQAACP